MLKRKNIIIASCVLLLSVLVSAPASFAKPNEFDTIAKHLQSKYQAKKVHIPFMFLARAAVKIVRPAGVKSFNVTLFEDLKFSAQSLDKEMQYAMRNSFGPEWTSVFRVRSNDGEQAYMYMKEDGKNVKLALVTINKEDAAIIRATFSPDKLAEFINNPKIFGISLGDGAQANRLNINKGNAASESDKDNDR